MGMWLRGKMPLSSIPHIATSTTITVTATATNYNNMRDL